MPSTAALDALTAVFTAQFGAASYEFEATERETTIVKRIPMFRAGTFKDSKGRKTTWTTDDLAAMVDNFEHLRGAGLLTDVPVRRDHSWSVDAVVGYIASLAVEGTRLLADVEFTEPDALEKFRRGTYRARSAEIGPYESNDESIFNPVVLGLAFVDIPAVEGLHRGSQPVQSYAYAGPVTNEETPVPTEKPAPTFTFRVLGSQETTDFSQVQAYIVDLERAYNEKASEADTYRAAIQGRELVDRKNFVANLAKENKVAAPQVAGLTSLVETMTPEQYDAFVKTYEAAPALQILGEHGSQDGGSPNTGDPVGEQIAVLEETLRQFELARLTPEQIEKTSAFKKLQTLRGSK